MCALTCILNEIDLYKTWVPSLMFPRMRLDESFQIHPISKTDQLAYLRAAIPWPMAHRDLILRVYGMDMMSRDNKIVVSLHSTGSGDSGGGDGGKEDGEEAGGGGGGGVGEEGSSSGSGDGGGQPSNDSGGSGAGASPESSAGMAGPAQSPSPDSVPENKIWK